MLKGKKSDDDALLNILIDIRKQQTRLVKGMETIMAELDDLNTAVANLQAAVNTAIAKIDALKAAPAGVDPAAVATAATAIQAAVDSLNTASA